MYYAVFIGRRKGVYNTWNECKVHVLGYVGNKFKSFPNLEMARYYSKHGTSKPWRKITSMFKASSTPALT